MKNTIKKFKVSFIYNDLSCEQATIEIKSKKGQSNSELEKIAVDTACKKLFGSKSIWKSDNCMIRGIGYIMNTTYDIDPAMVCEIEEI